MGHKSKNNSPFALLQELEARGRAHQAQLPEQEDVREKWAGIGFRLGRQRLLMPMNQVTEILTYPQLSQVPRTRPWLKGLANVRGTLLPIMDLNGYLGQQNSALTRLSRVLVARHRDTIAGLLVDEVLGMRHFYQEEWRDDANELDDALRPYVAGAFVREGEHWLVFSVAALAGHPQFLKVAG